jgi:hypothetical protein
MEMTMNAHMITDHAGNTYSAARLDEQESPSFDTFGARKDAAYAALGRMSERKSAEMATVGDTVRILRAPRKSAALVGQVGRVIWRGKNQWAGRGRYRTSMQASMAEVLGLDYKIGVKVGEDVAWISGAAVESADYEMIHKQTPEEAAAESRAKEDAARQRVQDWVAAIHAIAVKDPNSAIFGQSTVAA